MFACRALWYYCRYDNWGKVVKLDELQLKVPLRIELNLPLDYDNQQVRPGL